MITLAAPQFDLSATLASGQVFRWREESGRCRGFIHGHPVSVSQANGTLLVEDGFPLPVRERDRVRVRRWSRSEEEHARRPTLTPTLSLEGRGEGGGVLLADHVTHYFALDHDLTAIHRAIDVDPVIHEAIAATPGLRILRQDPWECVASFLISAFNNIPRIRLIVDRLAQAYGTPLRWPDGVRGWAFPTPEALAGASPASLRALGLGYRAGYLVATARAVAGGVVEWERLRAMPSAEARAVLLGCRGCGEKVVECALLFGLGKLEAFPVDVWIERVIRQRYFRGRRVTPRRIRAFAARRFGALAGYAQQYLYHWARGLRHRGGRDGPAGAS